MGVWGVLSRKFFSEYNKYHKHVTGSSITKARARLLQYDRSRSAGIRRGDVVVVVEDLYLLFS